MKSDYNLMKRIFFKGGSKIPQKIIDFIEALGGI
jgi:hypothetical protein